MSLTSFSITELQQQFRTGAASPVEAIDALEARIAAVDTRIHGYLSRDFATARTLAEKADISLPKHCIPSRPLNGWNSPDELKRQVRDLGTRHHSLAECGKKFALNRCHNVLTGIQ